MTLQITLFNVERLLRGESCPFQCFPWDLVLEKTLYNCQRGETNTCLIPFESCRESTIFQSYLQIILQVKKVKVCCKDIKKNVEYIDSCRHVKGEFVSYVSDKQDKRGCVVFLTCISLVFTWVENWPLNQQTSYVGSTIFVSCLSLPNIFILK